MKMRKKKMRYTRETEMRYTRETGQKAIAPTGPTEGDPLVFNFDLHFCECVVGFGVLVVDPLWLTVDMMNK